MYSSPRKGRFHYEVFQLAVSRLSLVGGCSQETTDRQTAIDDLAEKVIAEKAEQKKQAEQEEEEKKQIESVGRTKAERVVEAYLLSMVRTLFDRFLTSQKF